MEVRSKRVRCNAAVYISTAVCPVENECWSILDIDLVQPMWFFGRCSAIEIVMLLSLKF
jgi:hypothetical protein